MVTVRYGGKAGASFTLVESEDMIVVRTRSGNSIVEADPSGVAPLSHHALSILEAFKLVEEFPVAGVAVLQARSRRQARAARDAAREALKREHDIRFAGRALMDPRSKAPVLYTENVFIKFADDARPAVCRRILRAHKMEVRREVGYIDNAFFTRAAEGIGMEVFDAALRLLEEGAVEVCHPELIRQRRDRAPAPQQWHLARTRIDGRVIDEGIDVNGAWKLAEGGGITIAVVDDGVDIDHEEFHGEGKIVAPRDVSLRTDNPRPGNKDNHGTACAGIACANGAHGAYGVAPKARLMPIRLVSGLGSQTEADAFAWAAQNGADVISCSWGPADGKWWDPDDPLHKQVVPLPDSTRLAIDYAVAQGRSGRGCVVFFAAGNGNENMDGDGYASYDKVIAVAACNDTGTRAAYSDFGAAVWCAFPSNNGTPSLTPGIWTTDRSGKLGYNSGQANKGDLEGNYINSFGGTSASTPGAAGVAALVLSRNPELRWDQVREVLKDTADKIDTASGTYDAGGHSPWYGYGRLNARRAVASAARATRSRG